MARVHDGPLERVDLAIEAVEWIGGDPSNSVALQPRGRGHRAGGLALVASGLVGEQRERFERWRAEAAVVEDARRGAHDRGRVQPTREQRRHGPIAAKPRGHGLAEDVAEAVDDLRLTGLLNRPHGIWRPVANAARSIATDDHGLTGSKA